MSPALELARHLVRLANGTPDDEALLGVELALVEPTHELITALVEVAATTETGWAVHVIARDDPAALDDDAAFDAAYAQTAAAITAHLDRAFDRPPRD